MLPTEAPGAKELTKANHLADATEVFVLFDDGFDAGCVFLEEDVDGTTILRVGVVEKASASAEQMPALLGGPRKPKI